MKTMHSLHTTLLLLLALLTPLIPQGRQVLPTHVLFRDLRFRQGFVLSHADSSKGRSVEAVLNLGDANNVPAWRLCQWATKYSLATSPCTQPAADDLSYENQGKKVLVGRGNSPNRDLILEVRGSAEYGDRARRSGESWPHLLIEQDAVVLRPLDELDRIRFALSLRLLYCINRMSQNQYDPGLHAAQFQMFFIIRNISPDSPDRDDFFWFGVPFFDNRHDIPPAYMAQDAGKNDATGKFIYTVAGRSVGVAPLRPGQWLTLDADLLPFIRSGLQEAVKRGYLQDADPSHYAAANMNLGWEIPGTFDAAIQIRDLHVSAVTGGNYEIHPATANSEEEFERLANALKPGDELVLHGGEYSQKNRRAVTANGTAEAPIVIRAAEGQSPLLTRPAEQIDRYNNIEFVDCSYLIIRRLRFRGGSSGVRFIRGHHITFEDCEVFETGNNALTMNSGDCDSFIIRRNHLHHTGLSTTRPTEGEGMYIGCHDGSCITTNTLVEGNYIHHLRSTSDGGNDGIEIKAGSYGNIVRDNVIHDTNIGRQYPGIFVYGGGPGINIVESNAIWNAGEGIQVVSDAIVRNNIIFNCSVTGITAAPHVAVRQMRNVTIVNNTVVNHPKGVLVRWSEAVNMVFANNAVYCPGRTAIDASEMADATAGANCVEGHLAGVVVDGSRFLDGGRISQAFIEPQENDFWPRSGSPLIGQADGAFTVERDFNRTVRQPPCDIGAYETEGQAQNPGWKVQAGFKPMQ